MSDLPADPSDDAEPNAVTNPPDPHPREPSRTSARSSRTTWLALGLGLFACLALHWWAVDRAPPYLDFDSATQVIFINNIAERGDHDYYFADSPVYEDSYRSNWADQYLPIAVPLALLKTVLRLAPGQTAAMVVTVSVMLALLACFLAAGAIRALGETDLASLGFTVLGGWLMPSFFLLGRSGVPNIMLACVLFWAGIWLFAVYCRSGRLSALYSFAALLGLHLLLAYPTALAMPVFMVVILARSPQRRARLLSWHVPLSIAVLPLAAIAMAMLASRLGGVPISDYIAGARAFYDHRSGGLQAAGDGLGERLWRFLRAQFALEQGLGRSRHEFLWLYGHLLWSWLAIAALAVWGVIDAWRRDDRAGRIAGLALLLSLTLYITLATPEIRYLAALSPVYFYLAARGLARLPATTRLWGLTTVLLILALESAWVIDRHYKPWMLERWSPYAGEKEAIAYIESQEFDDDTLVLLAPPDHHDEVYHNFLHVQAYADFDLVVPSHHTELMRVRAAGMPAMTSFILIPVDDQDATDRFTTVGYRHEATITDRPSGRRLQLFRYDLPSGVAGTADGD